jgi:hypothetical protein
VLAVVGKRLLDRGGLGRQLARPWRRLAEVELEHPLGPSALDLGVGADQLLRSEGLTRVDRSEEAVGVTVDPGVDHLHRPVGRALLVSLLQERGERGAHRLTIGGTEPLVIALASALVGRLVVVGLLLGALELRERRVERGAYSFIESIVKRIRRHGLNLTRSHVAPQEIFET